MALGCGMTIVKYGIFVFNLLCAVRSRMDSDIILF